MFDETEFKEVIEVLKDHDHQYLREVLRLVKMLDIGATQAVITKNKPNKHPDIVNFDSYENKLQLEEILELAESKEVFRLIKDLQDYISKKKKLTKARYTKKELIQIYVELLANASKEELTIEKEKLLSLKDDKVAHFIGMANEIVNARKVKKF